MFTHKVSKKIYPVILSGGRGERLWPLSRKTLPKQFLRLCSDKTMFQEVVLRANNLGYTEPVTIVCSQDHEFIVSELLAQINSAPSSLILEPLACNTAPAITIAALEILNKDPEGVLLVLPSDHMIDDQEQFSQNICNSLALAEGGYIVAFGVEASDANVNYGYIKLGEVISKEDNIFKINQFVEKPDQEKAQEYLKAGNYYWNAGIFLFKAAVFLEEMEKHNPSLLENCKEAFYRSVRKKDLISLQADSFGLCESISIDYALMEKTTRSACTVLKLDWADVGSWTSLWKISPKDFDGNVVKGDAYLSSSYNNYIHSTSKPLAVIGVEDLIVVETDDVVLITKRDKDKEKELRNLINKIKSSV